MAKRKSEIKITVKASEALTEAPQPRLQCIYDSKLIIPPEKTMTNTRYEFEPGEIKAVHPLDYSTLLALEKKTGGCCGGGPVGSRKYFKEVD